MAVTVRHLNRSIEALPHVLLAPVSTERLLGLHSSWGPVSSMLAAFTGPGVLGGLHLDPTLLDVDRVIRALAQNTGYSFSVNATMNNEGKGFDLAEALLPALGETYERLAGMLACFAHLDSSVVASFESLAERGVDAVDPEVCPVVAPEQLAEPGCPFEPFSRQTPLTWIVGTRLFAETPVLVPAQLVDMLNFRRPGEPLLFKASSTGMAAGPTRMAAVEAGLLEVIERDALNLSWLSKVAPSPVSLDALESIAPRQRAVIEKTRADVRLREHRTDVPGIHVVSVVEIREDSDRYGLCLGHAAAADLGIAAADAIAESVQIRQRLEMVALNPRWGYAQAVANAMPRADEDYRRLNGVLGGIAHYGDPGNLSKALPYLLGPEEEVAEPSDKEREVRLSGWTARDAVRAIGIDPIVVDLDAPRSRYVRSRAPAHVVKVLVPELTHGSLPGYPMLGHPRLRSFPYTIGVTDEPLRYADLNDLLYPYM